MKRKAEGPYACAICSRKGAPVSFASDHALARHKHSAAHMRQHRVGLALERGRSVAPPPSSAAHAICQQVRDKLAPLLSATYVLRRPRALRVPPEQLFCAEVVCVSLSRSRPCQKCLQGPASSRQTLSLHPVTMKPSLTGGGLALCLGGPAAGFASA